MATVLAGSFFVAVDDGVAHGLGDGDGEVVFLIAVEAQAFGDIAGELFDPGELFQLAWNGQLNGFVFGHASLACHGLERPSASKLDAGQSLHRLMEQGRLVELDVERPVQPPVSVGKAQGGDPNA